LEAQGVVRCQGVADGGEVVGLKCRQHFAPQEDSWYIFVKGKINPRTVVWLGLGKLKKSKRTAAFLVKPYWLRETPCLKRERKPSSAVTAEE
jgi:hypothetical protein